MRLPRWLHHLYASVLGYFWVPCRSCGRPFGGHERGGGTLYYAPGQGWMLCPRCPEDRWEAGGRRISANDFVKWSDGDVTPSPEFWDAVRKWADATPRQALIEGVVEWAMATGHDSTLGDAPDIADYALAALTASGYRCEQIPPRIRGSERS